MEESVSLHWSKSSYSGNGGGNCVEVAAVRDGAAVRDSKDQSGAVLRFTGDSWRAFLANVRAGNL